MKRPLSIISGMAVAALLTSFVGQAQVFCNFDSHPATDNGTVMFRAPTFSGSTSAKLLTTPAFSIVTDAPPAPPLDGSTYVMKVQFEFNPTAVDPWVRLTTYNTANIPNPTVDFTQWVIFNVYAEQPIAIALGLRETGTTAAIGANGGGSGGTGIEFVGAATKLGAAPVPRRVVAPGQWQTLSFNLPAEPAVAFTGNGVLESPTGKGVLEHLALVPVVHPGDIPGGYTLYLDNFRVSPVPEPATWGLLAGLGLAGFGLWRRLQNKRA